MRASQNLKSGWLVAGIVLAMAATGGAQAQSTLLTSTGFTIEQRTATDLSCDALSTQLAEIDESGYRTGGPAPANDADAEIYEYELRLSVEYFWRCATRLDGDVQSDAFRSGFADTNTDTKTE